MHVGRRERKQNTSNDTNYHVKGDAGMREEQRDVRSLEMRDTSSTERLKKEPPGGVFQHGWIIFICHNRHTPHYLWARDWMVTSFCSVSLESFRAHVAFHKKKKKRVCGNNVRSRHRSLLCSFMRHRSIIVPRSHLLTQSQSPIWRRKSSG